MSSSVSQQAASTVLSINIPQLYKWESVGSTHTVGGTPVPSLGCLEKGILSTSCSTSQFIQINYTNFIGQVGLRHEFEGLVRGVLQSGHCMKGLPQPIGGHRGQRRPSKRSRNLIRFVQREHANWNAKSVSVNSLRPEPEVTDRGKLFLASLP